ncbi:MAG TPA: hypothetical protein VLE48_01065 [Terriglobales bacterium]|nr:hypothetical protein [Terriglobales bacterium]
MQTITQRKRANCTREEARQLLHDLRAAYQTLGPEVRDEIRDALTELGAQRISANLWQPAALALEAR